MRQLRGEFVFTEGLGDLGRQQLKAQLLRVICKDIDYTQHRQKGVKDAWDAGHRREHSWSRNGWIDQIWMSGIDIVAHIGAA